jgi:hypothetical protein
MIELLGGGTSVRISPTVWTMTLELSRIAGWQPAGTRRTNGGSDSAPYAAPPQLSWLIQYTTSDGQMVDKSDAVRLADALERAATDCDQLVNDYQQGRIDAPPLRTPGNGFAWFCTKSGREHLRALAEFCRRGSFRIQ